MGQLPDALPLEQRLAIYLAFAERALERSNTATDPEIRAELLRVATGWQRLIADLETGQEAARDFPKPPAR